MAPDGATRRSALSLLVCWGGLIVVMLTGERLFLLAKAGDDIVTFTEVPHILGRGLVSDSATALAVLLLSFPLALLFSLLFHVAGRGRPLCHDSTEAPWWRSRRLRRGGYRARHGRGLLHLQPSAS